jgi:glycine betaine/proline transport system substrate-binding protein
MKRTAQMKWLLSVIALGLLSQPVRAAEVVLAYPSTPYGDAFMSVIKAIIGDRLGVQARLLSSSNPVIFKAMDANRGDMDIGTVQLPNSQSLVDEYVTRKGTVVLAPNAWQFQQGACTIKPVADKYGIKSIYDLTRPEIVHLTAKGNDNKGEYWVGAAEWNSTSIDKARARHYGLTDLYNLTTSQADLEYARVSSAIKTATPIFWACDGASNFIFPKDAIAMLSEPAHDPAQWHPVLPSQDPDWYQKTKVDTDWPPVRSQFVYAKHLQSDFPEVARLIEHIKLTPELIGTWTYATISEKRDRDDYAKEWVKNNPAIVNGWMAQ